VEVSGDRIESDNGVQLELGDVYTFPDTQTAANDCLDEMLADLRRRFLSVMLKTVARPMKTRDASQIY